MPEEDSKKKKGIIRLFDKIMMGVIVGGAIGSVIGMTVAPKKGKETRKLLKEKGKEFMNDHQDQFHEVKEVARETSGSVFHIFKRKKKSNWRLSRNEMRRIPHENFEEMEEIES